MEKKPNQENKSINYVHKSIIHVENIGKEKKYESKNFKYDYTFSPYTFYPVTEKPTSINSERPFTSKETINRTFKKEYKVNVDPISNAFMKDRISRSIAKHSQTPKERFDIPQTSSQEYGWFSKPLVNNKKWDRPVSSTAITQYVDDYKRLLKVNPFSLPISSFKLK